jgi:hypothetical protein
LEVTMNARSPSSRVAVHGEVTDWTHMVAEIR